MATKPNPGPPMPVPFPPLGTSVSSPPFPQITSLPGVPSIRSPADVPEIVHVPGGGVVVVGGGVVVVGGGVVVATPSAAMAEGRNSRWKLCPTSESAIDGPLFRSAFSTAESVGEPAASNSTATAPATCGVACDVPPCVTPAAVMIAPGASIIGLAHTCEKHVIWSATDVASVHLSSAFGPPQVWPPVLLSYTAPTGKAPGIHAGREMPTWFDPLENRLLPAAMTGMIPAARALANAATRASAGSLQGDVL